MRDEGLEEHMVLEFWQSLMSKMRRQFVTCLNWFEFRTILSSEAYLQLPQTKFQFLSELSALPFRAICFRCIFGLPLTAGYTHLET